MKLFLALAVSALAAKPVPIKIKAGLGGNGAIKPAHVSVPVLRPTISVPSLEGLSLAPNPLAAVDTFSDFAAQTVELGEAGAGSGEAKVTAMAQAETAAVPGDAALAFDGFEVADTRELKKGMVPAQSPAVGGPMGLGALERKGSRWAQDGARLTRLGKGTIGTVDVHPSKPGLIVKTIEPSFDQLFMGLTYDTAIEADDKAAEVLAQAGVGPRVIGTAVVKGRRVSVRERIFGKTMQQLSNEKKFGESEEKLVYDMLRRMASANTLVTDLKPENIMIGHTEKDLEVKAWFIDGGMIEELSPELDLEGRFQRILHFPNVVAVRQDMNSGQMIESYRTLDSYLQDERERRTMKPWRYFLKSIVQAYMRGGAGMGLPK